VGRNSRRPRSRADRGAVARPQTGYDADVIEEAASLCESLLQNHPFMDGNKRSAVAATAVFFALERISAAIFGSRNVRLADVFLPDRKHQ